MRLKILYSTNIYLIPIMKLLTHFRTALVIVLMTLVLSGCSNSAPKLLDKVPAKTDMVAVIDAESILESAGGSIKDSKIVFPQYFSNILSDSDMEKLEPVLKAGCVDLSSLVFAGNYDEISPFMIFGLKDAEAFRKLLRDADFEKVCSQDDFVCYVTSDYRPTIAVVSNQIAVVYFKVYNVDEFNALKHTRNMFDSAKESSFRDTKFGKHLGGHTGAMVARIPSDAVDYYESCNIPVPQVVRNASVLAFTDLKSDELAIHMELLDHDGKTIDLMSFAPKGVKFKPSTVNKKALKFFHENEVFIGAVSCKDVQWDEVFEGLASQLTSTSDRTALAAIEPYVSNINGTVAIGWGPVNGLASLNNMRRSYYYNINPFSASTFTIVVELKDGKAKSTVRQLQSLAEGFNVLVSETSNGFSLSHSDISAYVEAYNNFLVISTKKINTGSNYNLTADFLDWGDYFCGIGMVLDEKSDIMRDLELRGYRVSVETYCDSPHGIDFRFKCTGGSENGLIERVVKAAIAVTDHSPSF